MWLEDARQHSRGDTRTIIHGLDHHPAVFFPQDHLDASRAESELGWVPRDPVETLADTVKDLEERGVVWPDPASSTQNGAIPMVSKLISRVTDEVARRKGDESVR